MRPLQVFSVVPKLPANLEPLWELAYNCYFSWHDEVIELFSQMDPVLWRTCDGNPVMFLNRLPLKRLEELADDEFFVERVADIREMLESYKQRTTSPVTFEGAKPGEKVIAYFSFEYGIDASLPIYSGGLGILAGDHLKSASDMNIPLIGIGLAYKNGYFRQYMTSDGWQQERYPDYDFDQMPMRLCKDDAGEPVMVTVDVADRQLHARVWEVQVGRVSLYLMDTNIDANPQDLRELTQRLYSGDLDMRVKQEILLGIGGVKVLDALGYHPSVIHMNEGHSAFAGLERIRHYMDDHGLPLEAAMELVASSSIFTTHTPVPAGNDRFPPDLMHRYFDRYASTMGLAWKVFMALGRENPHDDAEHFCMTVCALKLSRFCNGVSLLHGHVSRNMWKNVWPQYPVEDVPIGAITNGVHFSTWISQDLGTLYDRYLGNWREDPDQLRVWGQASTIPDVELWRTHERLRERLVDFVRMRLKQQLLRQGARRRELEVAEEVLDPQALTICFARRFATYKRATLILHDVERLKAMLGNTDRPVQFIFAGKAHPRDNEGKKLIQKLIQFCRLPECRYSMVFLEDYDMDLAKYMYQGCDIWLNNPRRPLEACGTSGMKAMANGVLNFSTLDGWWDEAYENDNSVGFGIGRGEDYTDHEYQDFVEAQTLYTNLENEIIPDFYERSHGNLPRTWIRRMKQALVKLGAQFNAHRMVLDYANDAYLPAFESHKRLVQDNFGPTKELANWRMELFTHWNELSLRNVSTEASGKLFVGSSFAVRCELYLGALKPQDVRVEVYCGSLNQDGEFSRRETTVMQPEGQPTEGWHTYTAKVSPDSAGSYGYTIRVLPHHELLVDPHSLGLIHWAEQDA